MRKVHIHEKDRELYAMDPACKEDAREPNATTITAMIEAERIARDPTYRKYSDAEEAIAELHRCCEKDSCVEND